MELLFLLMFGVRTVGGFVDCMAGPTYYYELGDSCWHLYDLNNDGGKVDLLDYQVLQNNFWETV